MSDETTRQVKRFAVTVYDDLVEGGRRLEVFVSANRIIHLHIVGGNQHDGFLLDSESVEHLIETLRKCKHLVHTPSPDEAQPALVPACPVTAQELRAFASGFALSDQIDFANMLRKLADWLEQAAERPKLTREQVLESVRAGLAEAQNEALEATVRRLEGELAEARKYLQASMEAHNGTATKLAVVQIERDSAREQRDKLAVLCKDTLEKARSPRRRRSLVPNSTPEITQNEQMATD